MTRTDGSSWQLRSQLALLDVRAWPARVWVQQLELPAAAAPGTVLPAWDVSLHWLGEDLLLLGNGGWSS